MFHFEHRIAVDKVYCHDWVNHEIGRIAVCQNGGCLVTIIANLFRTHPNEHRTMVANRRFDNTVLPASEPSIESFWEIAAHERDPKKNSKITQQIDDAIREHERNVSRGRITRKKSWQL
jgi:hypothetical protein